MCKIKGKKALKQNFSITTLPKELRQVWAVRIKPERQEAVSVFLDTDNDGEKYWEIVVFANTPYSLPGLMAQAVAQLDAEQAAWRAKESLVEVRR